MTFNLPRPSPSRARQGAMLGALTLALGACASATPDAPAAPPASPPTHEARLRGRDEARRPGGCPPLFVSPAGEPFRTGRGDAPCGLATWFTGADRDHDGRLERAEFQADALRFFDVLDVDGDHRLSSAEVLRYERLVLPEILGRRDEGEPRLIRVADPQQGGGMGGGGMGGGGMGGGGGGGPPPEEGAEPAGRSPDGAGAFGLLDEPEPVASCDLNFDGVITRAEFSTRAEQRFATLDARGDGALTLPELEVRLKRSALRR